MQSSRACPVCAEKRRQWVCPSCITLQVHVKRLACQHSFDACTVVEHSLLSSLSRDQVRLERAAERERRRMRVEQLRLAVQLEAAQVDQIKTRVAQAKPFLDDQHKLVAQAKSALEKRVADFNLTADEVKRFQQAAAAAPPAAAAATPAAPSSPSDPLRKILLEFEKPLASPTSSPAIALALRAILAYHRCRPFQSDGAEDAAIAQLNDGLRAFFHTSAPAATPIISALASSSDVDWVKPVARLDQRSFLPLTHVIDKARAILAQALPSWPFKGHIATKHVPSVPGSEPCVSPDEYRQLQHELASALRPTGAAPSSPSRPSATAAASSSSSRLWQLTPAFTSNMRSYLLTVESKLAKVRLGLMSRMLDLYVIRRKSPYSCSIVGLEIYDDPQELFNHPEPPPPPIEHPNPGSAAHLQMIQQQQALLAKQAQQQGNNGMNGEIVAAALGYTLLVLHLLSCYLSIHVPYALRFHGSHSYVEFNDEEGSRYFLTLLDNSNPNHFRRAITLLNHDIQFMCESAGGNLAATAAWKKHAQGHHAVATAANLAPLHLLPNMLKMIETAERSLKQQHADPHALQEQRMLQAQAIFRTQELERQRMQATLQKQQQEQQQQQLWLQQQARAIAPVYSPSQHLALDASISQSMVAVHREDALPPHHASSKPPPQQRRSGNGGGGADHALAHVDVLPPGFEHPSFGRLDSPPFYSEHAQSQAAQGLGADTLAASPLQRTLSGGSNSSSGSGSASPADASSPIKAPMQGASGGNTFIPFSAPGMQSYVMTEEPRESMLFTKDQLQRMSSQPRGPPAAFNFATPQRTAAAATGPAAVTLKSPPPPPFHDASGVHRALSYASPSQQQQHAPRTSPTGAAAAGVPVLPNAAAQFGFLDASHPLHPSHHLLGTPPPANAAAGASTAGAFSDRSLMRVASSPMQMQQPFARPPAHPQMSPQLPSHQRPILSSPFSRPAAAVGSPSSAGFSPSPAPLSSPSPLPPSLGAGGGMSLPAVSYAAETEGEWDLIDVVRDDEIDRGEHARRGQGHASGAGRMTSQFQPQR